MHCRVLVNYFHGINYFKMSIPRSFVAFRWNESQFLYMFSRFRCSIQTSKGKVYKFDSEISDCVRVVASAFNATK